MRDVLVYSVVFSSHLTGRQTRRLEEDVEIDKAVIDHHDSLLRKIRIIISVFVCPFNDIIITTPLHQRKRELAQFCSHFDTTVLTASS